MKRCTLKIERVEPIVLTVQDISHARFEAKDTITLAPDETEKIFPARCVVFSDGRKYACLTKPLMVYSRGDPRRPRKTQWASWKEHAGWRWDLWKLNPKYEGVNLHLTVGGPEHSPGLDGRSQKICLHTDCAAGTELAWEYAFQRIPAWEGFLSSREAGERSYFFQDCLSVGKFAVPYTYPLDPEQKKKWKDAWPYWAQDLLKMNPEQWNFFISAIEGHYIGDVFTTEERAGQFKYSRQFQDRLQQLHGASRVIRTGCFHGYEGNCVSFSVGKQVRLLWTLTSERGQVFVVDSPAVSACYIFTNQARAQEWAIGRIRATEAQEHAIRVVHRGSWEERISKALTALGIAAPRP